MAIDLSQFYQVFFDETEEHLAAMESLLLALDPGHPDPEAVNAIFRAAHSIKGSSATFGFKEMADLTHVLEGLLDRVRKGDLAFSPALVDACLNAGDLLKAQLAAYRAEQPADAESTAETMALLAALGHGSGDAPAVAPRCRIVDFEPSARALWDPAPIAAMLDELRTLGSCEVLHQPPGGIGAEPWSLRIEAAVGDEELLEIVAYAADEASIRIREEEAQDVVDQAWGFFEPLPEAPHDASPAADALASSDGVAWAAPDGSCGLFELPETVPEAPPASEDEAPPPAQRGRAEAGTIRVSVERVDQLMNLVGELVITRSMLLQAAGEVDIATATRLQTGLSQLERNARDLQDAVMSIRMLPISMVFSRFPRVVHDLSRVLGKQVELKTRGEQTELDKGLIEQIADPLVHLLRNALDHGIETAEVRQAAGKSPLGTVVLSARHQGGSIVIEVSDDGAGLDRPRILARARERGLPCSERMSDAEVWQLIFEPGFSTAETVTDISGRGVGMDVVRRNVQALGGRIEIESMRGVGTRFSVHLPLTLAIVDGMIVGLGEECYVLPLNQIVESLQIDPGMVRSLSGAARMIQLRGEYLPVIELGRSLEVPGAGTDWTRGIMVVVEADGGRAALLVDALLGQQQVVIKNLEANYRQVVGLSGATILGDGRVALILDVPALVAQGRSAASEAG